MVEGSAALRLVKAGKFVGRGGLKLESAIAISGIAVAGRSAFDAGASTGGFTDCLLQAGASSVVALDVGYGQLDWKLRTDDRVTVLERTNLRHVNAVKLGAPFDVIVADLSFISLVTVGPALASLGEASSDYLLLVKPQFELSKELVARGGIVRDSALHTKALSDVAAGLDSCGLGAIGASGSPITGAGGNREFFLHLRLGDRILEAGEIDRVTLP